MIYKKPKNVRYVDMCIYIDSKIKDSVNDMSDEESSLIFEYLYLIIYMLSKKQKYFNKESYYDDFSIWLAGDVFNRLFTNPKLNQQNPDGSMKLVRIKSCLNYIKSILYGRKVTFEQNNYSQKFTELKNIEDLSNAKILTTFRESVDFTVSSNVTIYLDSISKTIYNYLLNNSPYRKDKILLKNIYISCMLSVLNSIVFTSQEEENINSKYTTQEAKFRYLCRIYKNQKRNCIILYHLPNEYKNYLTITVRHLFRIIGQEIQELCSEQITIPEDVLMNVSLMEILGKNYYDD